MVLRAVADGSVPPKDALAELRERERTALAHATVELLTSGPLDRLRHF